MMRGSAWNCSIEMEADSGFPEPEMCPLRHHPFAKGNPESRVPDEHANSEVWALICHCVEQIPNFIDLATAAFGLEHLPWVELPPKEKNATASFRDGELRGGKKVGVVDEEGYSTSIFDAPAVLPWSEKARPISFRLDARVHYTDSRKIKSSVRSAKSRSLLSKSATGRSAGICAKRHRSQDFDFEAARGY